MFRLLRPRQWVKNLLVFAAPVFAKEIFVPASLATALLAFAAFCIASSSVYVVNDLVDVERDRLHPDKRNRPVASGRVSVKAARVWSAILLACGVMLTAASGHPAALVVVAVYTLLNLAYNLGAKHVALVDVFLLASYYLLRVTLGCTLVEVVPSNWLLLCTSALALFLALAKRRSDIVLGLDVEHRPALHGYERSFLDQAMGITAATTLISYSLYCLEAAVLIQGREFASLPFVVFGVLEYLRLAHVHDAGGAPDEVLLHSPALLVCGFGWLAAIYWSVQLPGG